MSKPMIELRGVTKAFGEQRPLDGVDLVVEEGQYVCIVGPSGAGKSTLMHLVAALDKPDAGTIVVDGHELGHYRHLTEYRRREIGLVFQLHNLMPDLTAEQNVEIAMFGTERKRAARAARARQLLDQVGLSRKYDDRPPTMSGGERQRVAIARALANEPKVLLSDEATGSLDEEAADQVIALFSQLRDEHGVTILAVSHDPRFISGADMVYRLQNGKLAPGVPTR